MQNGIRADLAVVPGARFQYGKHTFVADNAPTDDDDSLFQAVLASGQLPARLTVASLRLAIVKFATGAGCILAKKLMDRLTDGQFTDFGDCVRRKLASLDAATGNFEIVLLAYVLRVNLFVLRQAKLGGKMEIFQAKLFLQDVPLPLPQFVARASIYLHQRQTRLGLNGAVRSHFLNLRLLSSSDSDESPVSYADAALTALISSDSVKSGGAVPAARASLPTIATAMPAPSTVVVVSAVPDGAIANGQMRSSGLRRSLVGSFSNESSKGPALKRSRNNPSKINNGDDFRLLVDHSAFCVNRNVVARNSLVFRDFFASELFTKSQQNPLWNGRDLIVRLPGVADVPVSAFPDAVGDPSHIFRRFLELMSNFSDIDHVTSADLAYMIVIAAKLKCERILLRCEVEIAGRMRNACPDLLVFSRRFNLRQLRRSQLSLFAVEVETNFALIGQVSEQDMSEYFETATRLAPVKLMIVALIFLCGLNERNQIRKRGDFYEISQRLATCEKWVDLCARKCKSLSDVVALYRLVSKTRLVRHDGRYDDVALRDRIILSLATKSGTVARNTSLL